MLDVQSLTLNEIATIENLSGQSIAAFEDDTKPKGLAMAALALIAKRHAGDKTFTWNQAQQLTLSEAQELLHFAAADDSTGDVVPPEAPITLTPTEVAAPTPFLDPTPQSPLL